MNSRKTRFEVVIFRLGNLRSRVFWDQMEFPEDASTRCCFILHVSSLACMYVLFVAWTGSSATIASRGNLQCAHALIIWPALSPFPMFTISADDDIETTFCGFCTAVVHSSNRSQLKANNIYIYRCTYVKDLYLIRRALLGKGAVLAGGFTWWKGASNYSKTRLRYANLS